MSTALSKGEIDTIIKSLRVLLVDDSQFMRKIVRNLLLNVGVKEVYEAGDGIAALEAIRTVAPDIVILDWELPLLNGAELVRIVRSPGVFRCPTSLSSCSAALASVGGCWKRRGSNI